MSRETLKETAEQLVSHCRNGTEEKGLTELYAPDAESIEAIAMPGSDSPKTSGVDGIRAKHAGWKNTFEVHSSEVEGPFLHGDDRFSVIFSIDATNKDSSERVSMKEVAVYTVSNGKIIREEFYY
uniref:nuclear transport factor 2 family protein n=1 Tax=Pararhizobium sp. IMCC3301 TaxID=3067904 RepID=UPI0027403B5E|nr:nuclear transport factor 2 family protein [Pararhizobium sp. IMCC3301]